MFWKRGVQEINPRIKKESGSDQGEKEPRETGPKPKQLVLQFRTSLFNHGKARSIERGNTEPVQLDIDGLTGDSRGMAHEFVDQLTPYNPSKPPDLYREQEQQKRLRIREDEAEPALKYAQANVREKSAATAKKRINSPIPQAPVWLEWLACFCIAISVIPTTHDVLADSLRDEFVSWMVAVGSGCIIGFLVVWSILGSLDLPYSKNLHRAGIVGGISIGLALGLVRLAAAESSREVILVCGLTLLEVATVLLISYVADAVRAARGAWQGRWNNYQEALASHEAAEKERDRRQQELDDLNARSEAHQEYVEEREANFRKHDAIVEAAATAVLDGYYDGIAYNKGKLLGVIPEEDEE